MPNVLIIGATRGLGQSLANHYLSSGATVYGTARNDPSSEANPKIHWIKNVDIGTPDAGKTIIKAYNSSTAFDLVIISAGYFGTESFEKPDWEAQETMYRTSAIGPVFLVSALASAKLLSAGSKVIMVSSESGSIGLRHKSEGGGNYGHHASKAALNMVTKLLSLDLEEQKVAVGTVHPGFMRTEMTKGVGFDQFWDEGGGMSLHSFSLM